MSEKRCFKCGQKKSLADFYRHKMMADGHLNKCKECSKKDTRANRRENRVYYQEYDRKRANLPHRVEARKQYQCTENYRVSAAKGRKRYLERHPEIRKAHIIVGNFLRDGKLTKAESCEGCGSSERLHAHHSDYSRPLDVVWLCHVCHVEWHRNNQPAYAPEVNHASGIIPCD